MTNESKLPPGRSPLSNDWFIEKLGASQQKVMMLTVQNRSLKNDLEAARARIEELESQIESQGADQ